MLNKGDIVYYIEKNNIGRRGIIKALILTDAVNEIGMAGKILYKKYKVKPTDPSLKYEIWKDNYDFFKTQKEAYEFVKKQIKNKIDKLEDELVDLSLKYEQEGSKDE